MKFGASKETSKKDNVGQLRRTHLLTTNGPGSLVDLPDYSVIMGATDYWSHPLKIAEPRLALLLGVKDFREPAVSGDLHKDPGVVRAFRFPYWHYCPNCGALGPYWAIGDKKKTKCAKCGTPLVPSRFVMACERGHIEDFPYERWVHNGYQCPSKTKTQPRMKVEFATDRSGLDAIRITCLECGKSRTMANCTAQYALGNIRCNGHRPWVGNKKEDNDPTPCDAPVRALQRGASNVYFTVTASALTIPSRQSQLLEDNWDKIKRIWSRDRPEEDKRESLQDFFEDEMAEEGISIDELVSQIEEKLGSSSKLSIKMQDIFESEYLALTAPDTDAAQLKTQHVGTPDALDSLIDDVILVKRLREVLALRGFRRIKPTEGDDEEASSDEAKEFMPPSAGKLDWLPAMELLGEGIFIKVNLGALHDWEATVGNRYAAMGRRLAASNVTCENFSPAYVLLHTLSHVLIRQLTLDCGYSSSSIKERIYSTFPDSEIEMAGILLYTSSSDSDGSLGGLVRQGFPDRLIHTFEGALSNASWCSSDPICSESTAQGYDSLNYAACYACTLLPETSCAMRNCLLDRVSLVGTIDHPDLGFFSQILEK